MANSADTRRVWILGAGFSASLGAPLLHHLLSFRLRSKLVSSGLLLSGQDLDDGPDKATAYVQDLVYALYHHGTGYGEGYLLEPRLPAPRGERGLWSHPEEYLEYLDDLAAAGADRELGTIRDHFLATLVAQHGAVAKKDRLLLQLLRRETGGGLPPLIATEFSREAKRIVAAECCHFLRGVTESSERAKPYIAWLRKLGATPSSDSIITFNYDCLVEKLGQAANRDIVVAGASSSDIASQEHRANSLCSILLIKLHGSVDWKRTDRGNQAPPFQRANDFEYAAKFPEGQIATPGGSKLASSEGDLLAIWRLAARRIRDADEVIFVGYRIPESDAAAREMILDALAANAKQHLQVKIVLGPPSFDRDRLATLVQVALPSRNGADFSLDVQILDAWAQDYLQAWRVWIGH